MPIPQEVNASTLIEPSPHWRNLSPTPPSEAVRYICPISKVRFYVIPDGEGGQLAVPGVTSVLSSQDSSEDRERLESWRQRELAAGRDPNAGRDRGTRVHALLEDVVRGARTIDDVVSNETEEYASGMIKYLRPYTDYVWNERPLVTGWEHCWSPPDKEGNRLARVWSVTWGFAGTPDLIARRPGVPVLRQALTNERYGGAKQLLTILSDFKTSTRPYFRPHGGSRVPIHQTYPYKKYKKTARQLCAYRMAAKETLGLDIDLLQIIVGLPNKNEAQMFFLRNHEIEQETENFKKAAVVFWQRQAERAELLHQAA